jgi:hypothetical protein
MYLNSLRLNHSIETIRKGWTVKDYLSFETWSHLTNVSLKTMVSHAYSCCHNFGEKDNQDIFLSDTLIDELVPLDAFLQEDPSYEDISLTESIADFSRICTTRKYYYADISFTESIIDFSKICINSKNFGGIIHLLLGYNDVRKETVWLYAYFIRQEQKLVFLPCSSEPMRDVLMAASTIY